MHSIRPVRDATVLDVGCGTGFHLPRFLAAGASSVIGVEPHPGLARAAVRRMRDALDGDGRPNPRPDPGHVQVRVGSAQRLPVADRSIDVSHARWAYFFGPGCEPGLRELERVMRRGGVSFVIDNDATSSTFGRWFRTALPEYDPQAVERFWSRAGWQRRPLTIRWTFDRRADFESVVRIEFAPAAAERIIAEHEGLEVDYAVNLWWRGW